MTNNWPVWALLIIYSGPFVLWALGISYSLYLSYCHLDAMLEALKNSRYSYTWAPVLRRGGWIGCGLLIAKISGMIMMPRASIRFGELDPNDYEEFPVHLKRLLKIKSVMLISTGIWFVMTYVLAKFG